MVIAGEGGSIRRCADGEVVFREGDEGTHLYVINEGAVRIRKDGDIVATVVAEFGPGEMFGESAIIEHRPRSASAIAVGETELSLYDRESFLEALRQDPELALRAMGALTERLRVTTQRLQDVCTQHVLDRAEMILTERAILEAELS